MPGSIRSSLVGAPIVRSPSKSASCASLSASELARSVFAAVTAQNDRVGIARVARAHQSDHILDVGRLITDAHLGHSGKVDQRQIEDRRRIYLQVDALWRNAAWLRPFTRSVSRLISAQIYSKSKNFWPRG